MVCRPRYEVHITIYRPPDLQILSGRLIIVLLHSTPEKPYILSVEKLVPRVLNGRNLADSVAVMVLKPLLHMLILTMMRHA